MSGVGNRGARRHSRTIACGIAAAVGLAVGLATYAFDLLERLELETVDARFEVRGVEDPPDDLALVLIDDVTFDELGEQWPFPRSMHGRVIDRLNRDGAAAVAYDVQFTEPTVPREDNALIAAVGRMGGMTLATEEVDDEGGTDVFGGDEVLERFGARAGNTQLSPDPGGIERRFPYAVRGLEGFAVVTQEQRTGEAVNRGDFDDEREAWIDYRGPRGTFPSVEYSDVYGGDFEPGTFAGKTVIVGAAAPSLQDLHATPFSSDELMSGTEIQANALATVAAGNPLGEAPAGLNVALIGLLGLAVPGLSLRLGPLVALLIGVALTAAFLVFTQAAFEAGTIVALVPALLAVSVSAGGTLVAHYSLDAVDRIRMRDAFGRFVPAPVVDEALASAGEDLRLNGVRRDATVLFADLRGFTTLAESLEPEQVIDVLNHYLTEMSDAIMDHGGTLVAYMGDGIMAIFGAPLEQDDHAARALAAAREMVGARLDAFNTWLAGSDITSEPVEMGVGVNSGEVMSGNVGSPNRLEYAAVGDTTNTASRLEEMTKEMPHSLLVAESTRALAEREAPTGLTRVGDVEVRGRDGKLEVWGFAADGGRRGDDGGDRDAGDVRND
ncbi:MAG: adenylate/guanylate cyclase domain-containing protein [Solirubrobacterales bacterium]